MSVTFEYDQNDDRCLDSLALVQAGVEKYDSYVKTDLGDTQSELINEEMQTISVIVVIVVVTVLLLTSQAYAEVDEAEPADQNTILIPRAT